MELLVFLPILISGIIAIILDVHFRIKEPIGYWLLGNSGAIISFILLKIFVKG